MEVIILILSEFNYLFVCSSFHHSRSHQHYVFHRSHLHKKKCSGTFLVSNILHLMHKTGRILHKGHLAAQCHKAQAFCTVLWNVRCD